MTDTPSWTYRVPWLAANQAPVNLGLTADADARARIARLLDLESLERLDVDLRLEPWLDGLAICGSLQASAVRICGLSLEPFVEDVREPVEARFLPPRSPNLPARDPATPEIIIDPDAEDPPEPGLESGVDIGALAVQLLALALDPFPRRPGAVFQPVVEDPAISPFNVLAALRPISRDVS